MKTKVLEFIIKAAEDVETRAVAWAALTLTRVLDSEWTHAVKNRKTGEHETVVKPAGEIVGPREEVQKRLDAYIEYLSARYKTDE